jgi:hypothetical protein
VAALVAGGLRWELLVEEARAAHMALPLLLALERSTASVPASVLDQLERAAGPRWRRRLLESVLARPENPGTGHVLRLLFAKQGRLQTIRRHLFPSAEFCRRRHAGLRWPRMLRPWRLLKDAGATLWRHGTQPKESRA